VAFAIFLAGDFKKNSFEQEMRKNFKIFLTKNHKTMSFDFSKAYKKYVVLREKLKWPF
jgi:hypothetical protein